MLFWKEHLTLDPVSSVMLWKVLYVDAGELGALLIPGAGGGAAIPQAQTTTQLREKVTRRKLVSPEFIPYNLGYWCPPAMEIHMYSIKQLPWAATVGERLENASVINHPPFSTLNLISYFLNLISYFPWLRWAVPFRPC